MLSQSFYLILFFQFFAFSDLKISSVQFHIVTVTPQYESDLEFIEVLSKTFLYSILSPSPNIGIPHTFVINSQDFGFVKNLLDDSKLKMNFSVDPKYYNDFFAFNGLVHGYFQFNSREAFFANSPSELFKHQALKLNASVKLLGLSSEDREIYMGSFYSAQKEIATIDILLVGGLHSQSPLIPDFFKHFMDDLIMNQSFVNLRDMINWHFIPIINPDGFEYANLEDPLWVKNLSPGYDGCLGTHLLKNFMNIGTDDRCEPCSLLYPGAEAFSEVETRYLRTFIFSIRRSLKLYINVGFFGSFLTWTNNKIAQDRIVRKVLNESDFQCRASAKNTKQFFQNDLDWMAEIGVPYAFSLAVNSKNDFLNASKLIHELAMATKKRHILSKCVWAFQKVQNKAFCSFV